MMTLPVSRSAASFLFAGSAGSIVFCIPSSIRQTLPSCQHTSEDSTPSSVNLPSGSIYNKPCPSGPSAALVAAVAAAGAAGDAPTRQDSALRRYFVEAYYSAFGRPN